MTLELMALSAAMLALALSTEGTVDTERRAKTVDSGQHAQGSFEVKVTPVGGAGHGVASGHLALAKTFTGDLIGTSRGDMWTADTAVEGSAGYVAIEKIEGSVRGRKGSFTVIHQGTMRRGGDYQMRLVVVPDSGTDQLMGLSGTMTIRIEKGAHFYDLDYSLPVP
jgi:Protein of unknown function (DUF3224)